MEVEEDVKLRPRLTYSNVAATVALMIAIGGGTVYAAVQLGRNDVRSRNIAPGAVKAADIARNAVTSPKIRAGAVRASDIAIGVLNKVVDTKGSARGGPISVQGVGEAPVPLTGTTSFTPRAGQVSALAAEAQFTFATVDPGSPCSANVRLFLNDEPTRVFLSPDQQTSTTLVTELARDADGPFGLINPGAKLTVTAKVTRDQDCTAQSRLDRVEVRVLQIG